MPEINMAALTQETNNAVHLAESGLRLLDDMVHPHYDSAGMFACLALAAEKLTKIAYGLGIYHQTSEWPSKKIERLGHNLERLEPEARTFIVDFQKRTSKKALAMWVTNVSSIAWLTDLFSVLKNYGSGGRFHYLDSVVGSVRFQAPEDQWIELEEKVTTVPEGIHVKDLGEVINGRKRLIATGYRDWWTMFESAWIHGAFGPNGVRLSASISLSYPGGDSRDYLIRRGRELARY